MILVPECSHLFSCTAIHGSDKRGMRPHAHTKGKITYGRAHPELGPKDYQTVGFPRVIKTSCPCVPWSLPTWISFLMSSASTPTTITDPSPQRAMKLDDVPSDVHDLKIESAGSGSEVPERHYTKDFGLIPMPRHLRYDPSKPFHFGIALNVAFASTPSESDPFFGIPGRERNLSDRR